MVVNETAKYGVEAYAFLMFPRLSWTTHELADAIESRHIFTPRHAAICAALRETNITITKRHH